MSTLYLLRHGQASFGEADYDQLSWLGELQAAEAGRFLAARVGAFDRIVAGPSRRHAQTARGALAAFEAAPKLEIEPALDEFAHGHTLLDAAHARCLSGGLHWPQTSAAQMRLYGAEIRRWALEGEALPGVPTLDEFSCRAVAWFAQLAAQSPRGQRVLAVTSAGVIAVLMCAALHLPAGRMIDFVESIGNASVTSLAFSGTRRGLVSFNVATASDTAWSSRI
ncbi:histidine phosphatase family protein [Paraburkholderia sp. J7]|uniref:histidine phosphatase family protein n=1 Tax=Paraburkholderia sp. J7 TaxID=2805438 RepID=UPI002AB738E8|nr:histidine phosphatase family protein [Paraburkholderia sp. J7]